MDKTSNNTLINSLKDQNEQAFEDLYQEYYPMVKSLVMRTSGTTQDAEDVFQETIVVLLQKLRTEDFTLTSSIKTYLFAIAQNIWLKRKRDNHIIHVEVIEKYQKATDTFHIEVGSEKTVEEKLQTWLSKITDNCRRILKALFFYNDTMDVVAKRMGWKNRHTAANQKYKCIEQAKKARIRSENS